MDTLMISVAVIAVFLALALISARRKAKAGSDAGKGML